MVRVAAYQHGIYPRSEDVVAATRGLERGRTTQRDVDAAYASDREAFVALQRDAGLDYLSDGLLGWQDIFRPLVRLSGGLTARTLVRWFDNNAFFRAPEVTGELSPSAPLPSEMEEAIHLVPEPRVATLPSPYYFSRAAQSNEDRATLMMDLTREVLRPVVEAATSRGFALVHLQEPWMPYFGMDAAEWDDFEKAIGELRDALANDALLVLHLYFGDAAPYADRLRRLPVDAVGIDFVQTDLEALGNRWETGVLAGVLDGRSSPIESPEGTAEFAVRVADALSPPLLFLSSNCDLEMLPRDVAARKVTRLGEASRIAKERLA